MKMPAVVVFLFLYLLAGDTQAGEHVHKPDSHKHKQYARTRNPVPMTGQSIIKGRELFERQCIGCHGKGGKGNGNMDLMDEVWIHGDTDGELFQSITDGIEGTAMKGFKKELTEKMRWHLVNYIKSFQKQSGK